MKKQKFTRWRISDILLAMYKRTGKTDARRIADWLRKRDIAVERVIGFYWRHTLPGIFVESPVNGEHDTARIERVAKRLVAEAKRLKVPRRA